jgi:hypothetical protein
MRAAPFEGLARVGVHGLVLRVRTERVAVAAKRRTETTKPSERFIRLNTSSETLRKCGEMRTSPGQPKPHVSFSNLERPCHLASLPLPPPLS